MYQYTESRGLAVHPRPASALVRGFPYSRCPPHHLSVSNSSAYTCFSSPTVCTAPLCCSCTKFVLRLYCIHCTIFVLYLYCICTVFSTLYLYCICTGFTTLYLYCICTVFLLYLVSGVHSPFHCWVLWLPVHSDNLSVTAGNSSSQQVPSSCSIHFWSPSPLLSTLPLSILLQTMVLWNYRGGPSRPPLVKVNQAILAWSLRP